jgi:hypothetical protein
MSTLDPARWDDYILAALLLLVALPRCILAVIYERPLGVEGTLSILFVGIALALVIGRRRS